MRPDDKWDQNNLSLKPAKQGDLSDAPTAKSGSGGSVDKSLTAPNPVQKDGLIKDAAKKGTGATNDMKMIDRLANDHRLYA